MNPADHIFQIELIGYDGSQHFYFLGSPEVSADKFQGLCDLLFPEAAEIAAHSGTSLPKDDRRFLGTDDIIKQMIPMLGLYGFIFLPNKLKTASYTDETIISDRHYPIPDLENKLAYSKEMVYQYNQTISAAIDARYQKK